MIKNVQIQNGRNKLNIRTPVIVILIFVCTIIVLLPTILLHVGGSSKTHPEQYLESNGTTVSALFLQDALTSGLVKDDALLYHGLVRGDEIDRSIHDREAELRIINIMNRYWKANAHGDYQTRSGKLLFMHAEFHDNSTIVYFKMYRGYEEYDDDHAVYTSAKYICHN